MSPTGARGVAADVRAGRSRAVDVVEEALDRIADHNEALNAFCEVRAGAAREAARRIDAQVAAGADPGPLAGVPVAVKDAIWEAGVETTDGSRSLVGFVPEESAATVDRLVAAGAVIVGRTNTPEFCYRAICANELYGTTGNPWDVGRTSGGSSGGSAAAVGAGMVPLALGTDGGGSVRIPASLCGVVGMKPTFGLVPREPQWPGWWTLTHIGPIARTVGDAALLLSVLAGPDDRDPVSLPPLGHDLVAAATEGRDLRGLRIAYSEDLGYIRVDEGVRAAFRAAVERLAAAGASVEAAHPALPNPVDDWNTIVCVDNLASEGPLLSTGRVGADARGLIEPGEASSGRAYAEARNRQMAFAQSWARFMRGYDLVLTPAMECVAFRHGLMHPEVIGGEPIGEFYDDWCHFCYPFNLTGQPAISVPMGTAEDGMPIGLQIVGRRFEDHLVLRAAAAWERLSPWPEAPPLPAGTRPAATGLLAPLASPPGRVELDPSARLAAGMRVQAEDGVREVRRAYRPSDDALVVECSTG